MGSASAKTAIAKCCNINQQIGNIVSKKITVKAQAYIANAIVFEDLKGWKSKDGKKRSNLKQRFHGWLKSRIVELTQPKWANLGCKTITVMAASYTSELAYDGSGTVECDKKNYALATFYSGKKYSNRQGG